MANLVFIAGTFHGGWYWQTLKEKLTERGHRVFTPTLSGLEDSNPATGPINLDTHIDDVLRVIQQNDLQEVYIVGWSYGGMVVTGAADRTSAKVNGLIYLDAVITHSGQREWDTMLEKDKEPFLKMCTDGLNIAPPEGLLNFEPRMRPHPLATKLQPLFFDREKFDRFDKVFVFAEQWFHEPDVTSPFAPMLARAQVEPGWVTHSVPYGHDLLNEAPELVLEIILATIESHKA